MLSVLTLLGVGTLAQLPTPADVGCGLGEQAPAIRRTDSVLSLRLNVPAFRLEVRAHDTLVRTIRVAVGMPRYPTPRGHYAIDYVVWNPWWRPPDAEWARHEKVTPPGWSNPVGRVKLHVTGLVFLHGSPLEGSIGSAASHACVRLANRDAIALARLVHAHGSPSVRAETLDSLEGDTAATRQIALPLAVPLDIVYEPVEIIGDDLVVHPDIYRLAGRSLPTMLDLAIGAIRRAGRDTSALPLPVLEDRVRRGRAQTVVIPLDSLFVAPVDDAPRNRSATTRPAAAAR
jgi:hypothetical protein